MFKRRVEDSGKCPVWRFAFRIFYAHIANVLIMLVAAMLVENLGLLHIQVSDGVTPVVVTIVCFLFYVVYIYVQSWRVGQRDQNLILYKRETKQPLKICFFLPEGPVTVLPESAGVIETEPGVHVIS